MSKSKSMDPFEKMARDLVQVGEELVKKTRKNGRPDCPNCGGRLWKRKDGQFSCPDSECVRDVIPAEEIAGRKIVSKFTGSL